MKIILSALLFSILIAAQPVMAEPKPIFLNRADPNRDNICLRRVVVTFGGIKYALPRTQSMTYTGADGTAMEISNPAHPYNDCEITDAGTVTRFATGLLPSGLDLSVETVTDSFQSTYAEYKTQIDENMAQDKFEDLPGATSRLQWGTSIMYLLPPDPNETANGERVAIYCKLPPGVKNDSKTPREEKRKMCSTRYLFAKGVAFGYSYREGLKEYKPFELDYAARRELAGLVVKPKKPAAQTP